jgi:hypothetical protein
LLSEQKVKVKSNSSYCFQFNEMARPAGLEPAPFCLEGMQHKTLSAAAGVATRKRVIYLALELDRRWTEKPEVETPARGVELQWSVCVLSATSGSNNSIEYF